MRAPRQILVLTAILIAVIPLTIQWILPVALSFEAVHKPLQNSWAVPREPLDHSVAQSPGRTLSYFGYCFEVPWTDIDETKTKLYPNMVLLTFHSGLKLMVGASPQKLWLNGFSEKFKITQASVEQTLGVHSDYEFLATLYNFTPDKIHLWALSPRVHYRETFLLGYKSLALQPEAGNGFFYVGNSTLRGFQEGDPQNWPSNYRPRCRSTVLVELFSDRGSLDLTLFQKDFQDPAGVSQPQVNRLIQSVHRVDASVVGKNTVSH